MHSHYTVLTHVLRHSHMLYTYCCLYSSPPQMIAHNYNSLTLTLCVTYNNSPILLDVGTTVYTFNVDACPGCSPSTYVVHIHLQEAVTRAAVVTFYWRKHGLWRKRILHFFAAVSIPYNTQKFPFSRRTTSSSIDHRRLIPFLPTG